MIPITKGEAGEEADVLTPAIAFIVEVIDQLLALDIVRRCAVVLSLPSVPPTPPTEFTDVRSSVVWSRTNWN